MSLARKGANVFLANWLLAPLQLLTTAIITRFIGAEGLGTLFLLTTGITVVAMLGQLGVPAAAIYFLRSGIYTERTLMANYLVVIGIVSMAAISLVLILRDVVIATLFQGTQVGFGLIVLAFAGLPVTMATSFIATLLLARGQADTYLRLTVGGGLLSTIGTLFSVGVLGLGVRGALLATLVSQLIVAAAVTRTIITATAGQVYHLDRRTLAALLRFGLQQHVGTVGSQMFKRADTFLLAYFLDVSAVGYYSIASAVYDVVLSIPRAITGLLAGESSGRTPAQAALIVAQAGRNVLWLMCGAAVILALIAPWLIPLVYGQAFTQSVLPLLVLVAAAIWLGFTLSLQAYFLGIGKPHLNGIFTFAAGAANLGFSLWLIPSVGIVGNAIATLLGSLLSFALHMLWFRRLARVSLRSTYLLSAEDLAIWRGQLRQSVRRVRLLLQR